jgi:hypothetical protein
VFRSKFLKKFYQTLIDSTENVGIFWGFRLGEQAKNGFCVSS